MFMSILSAYRGHRQNDFRLSVFQFESREVHDWYVWVKAIEEAIDKSGK